MTEQEIKEFKEMVPKTIKLSQKDIELFMSLIENPPEPNEELKELFKNETL